MSQRRGKHTTWRYEFLPVTIQMGSGKWKDSCLKRRHGELCGLTIWESRNGCCMAAWKDTRATKPVINYTCFAFMHYLLALLLVCLPSCLDGFCSLQTSQSKIISGWHKVQQININPCQRSGVKKKKIESEILSTEILNGVTVTCRRDKRIYSWKNFGSSIHFKEKISPLTPNYEK